MPLCPSAHAVRLAFLSFAIAVSCPLTATAQLLEASDRIGWNFVFHSTEGSLASTDVAGLNDPTWGDFRQDNWNNEPTLNQSQSPVDPDIANLIDATGAAVTGADGLNGVSLDWFYTLLNSWHMTAPTTADPNEKLMYGYQALNPRIEVENIPYDCYTLVLYYNQDGFFGNSQVTLSEVGGSVITTRTVSTGDPDSNVNFFTDYQNGGFRVEDGVGAPIPSNVTVFYGLRTPDLQIHFDWLNDSSNSNTGTQALQIVDTPTVCIFADGFESGGTTLWN